MSQLKEQILKQNVLEEHRQVHELQVRIKELRADVERYVAINAQQVERAEKAEAELERLRGQNAAIEELLRAASEAIEVEVEKRLNALAPPGTAPVKLKVSLEVDPTMAASSTVDLEACQRERAARMLAADLLKHLPLSKTTSPRPQMVSDPRRFETWTWEGVIFVKQESKNADSL